VIGDQIAKTYNELLTFGQVGVNVRPLAETIHIDNVIRVDIDGIAYRMDKGVIGFVTFQGVVIHLVPKGKVPQANAK